MLVLERVVHQEHTEFRLGETPNERFGPNRSSAPESGQTIPEAETKKPLRGHCAGEAENSQKGEFRKRVGIEPINPLWAEWVGWTREAVSTSSRTSGDAQPTPPTGRMGCGAQKGHNSAPDSDKGWLLSPRTKPMR